jgi:hypothetical protein
MPDPIIMPALTAVKLLITTAKKAKDFHNFYSLRDGELKTFAECASQQLATAHKIPDAASHPPKLLQDPFALRHMHSSFDNDTGCNVGGPVGAEMT